MGLNYSDAEITVIGKEADDFFNGEVGKYVIEKSKAEIWDLMCQLRDIDPIKYKKVGEVQEKIRIAEKAIAWLNEAIAEYKAAGTI